MKISKRILSLFLSVLMLVTSVPAFAVATNAADSADKYLFAYFTGNDKVSSGTNTSQAIRFALSEDGKTFTGLNGGKPVIQQNKGTLNCRDPYVFKGQDGFFYAIATDMDASGGWWGNSNSFVLWKSADLINWQKETIINMSEVLGTNVTRAWAPQVIWDSSVNKYLVYFGLAEGSSGGNYANFETGNNTHMYGVYTTDLLDQSKYETTAFPMLKSAYDATDKDSIDGDITYSDGTYYMFFKDEYTKKINLATSSNLAGPYSDSRIVLEESTGGLEGCQLYQNGNGEYILIADIYGNSGNFVMYNFGTSLSAVFGSKPATLDLAAYKVDGSNISSLSPRHGSILKITTAQYNDLKDAQSFTTIVPATESALGTVSGDVEENNGIDLSGELLARYFVHDTTTDMDDTKGKFDLTPNGNVQWQQDANGGKGAAYLSADNYLYTNEVPQMLSTVTADKGMTISFFAQPSTEGNVASDGAPQGRFFEFNANGTKGSIVWDTRTNAKYLSMWYTSRVEISNNWVTDRIDMGTPDAGTYVGEWHQYTLTVDQNQIVVYKDGTKIAETAVTQFTSLLESMKQNGYLVIGAPCWPDVTYTGYLRDFRVYNRTVSSAEAQKLYNQYNYDNADYNMTDLKNLMTRCETEFATYAADTKNVYTGLKDAYDAYVDANEFFDAYYYGGQNIAPQVDTYARALEAALSRISVWKEKTGTASSILMNSGDMPQFYSNILYSDSSEYWGDNGNENNAISIKNYKFKFVAPKNVTLLATKNNVAGYPIHMEIVRDSYTTKNRNFNYVGSVTSGLKFIDYWYGYGSNYDKLTTETSMRIGYDSSHHRDGSSSQINFASARYFSNKLCVDYGALSFTNYKAYIKGFKADAYIVDSTVNGQVYNERLEINVLDYQAMLDALKSAMGKLSDITKYKEGGLSNLLAAIENAEVWDPNTYFTSSNDIDGCATAMGNAISALNGAAVTPDTTGYQAFRDVFEANVTIYNNTIGNTEGIYTSQSVADYYNVMQAARAVMCKPLASGYNSADSELAKSFADAITADPTKTILNPRVNVTELNNAISSASAITLFKDSVQKYPLDVFLGLQNTINEADTFSQASFNKGKYADVAATVGSVNYKKLTSDDSGVQAAIDAYIPKLTLDEVKDVISVESKQGFDAAYSVASTVPQEVYADYNEHIEKVNKIRAEYYITPEAAATRGYTGEVPEGVTEVIATDLDTGTNALITAINSLEKNTFTVTVNSTNEEYAYGEQKILPAQTTAGEWTITDDKGTRTVYVSANQELTLIVESKIDAVFKSNSKGDASSSNIVQICDGYGKTVSIIYTADTVDENYPTANSITAKVIPFYDFKEWKYTTSEADEKVTHKFVPQYKAQEVDGVRVDKEGTLVKYAKFDTAVTLTADGANYGWVNKTAAGNYQIVSYSQSFKFYAISNSDYYPFYKDTDYSYYVNDGGKVVTLSASNVENILPEDNQAVGESAENHLKFKLDNKYPFVYTEYATVIEPATGSAKGRYRVYARLTEGTNNYNAFGSEITVGPLNAKMSSSTITATNQFALTFKLSQAHIAGANGTINFKPYVNHSFKYANGVDAFYSSSIDLTV